MRRTVLLSMSIAAIAVMASGCDPMDGATSIRDGAQGIVGEEETAVDSGPASAEVAIEEEDAPDLSAPIDGEEPPEYETPMFTVAWTDGADAAPVKAFSFEVKNETASDRSVGVALVGESHVGSARVDLGTQEIPAGGSVSFGIDAGKLPVRSAVVVGRLYVELTRENVSGKGPFDVTTEEASRFVLHGAKLGTARAYSEQTLIDERDGALFSLPSTASSLTAKALDATILGEVLAADGTYEKISVADTGLASFGAAGAVADLVTNVSIGVADVGSLVPVVLSDEEAEAEMEVGDE